uniref:hypothetical protein n=1 Tax=Enterococcus faecium TaxID=1352 RepID=UPI00292D6A36
GASAAGDATTAASGAGASAGEAATQAAHFGLSYAYGEEPMAVTIVFPLTSGLITKESPAFSIVASVVGVRSLFKSVSLVVNV